MSERAAGGVRRTGGIGLVAAALLVPACGWHGDGSAGTGERSGRDPVRVRSRLVVPQRPRREARRAPAPDARLPRLPAVREARRAPAPDARLPGSPAALAPRLAEVSVELRRAIAAWRAERPGSRAFPPRRVQLLALFEQRACRTLARRPGLAAATLARLPPRTRFEIRDWVGGLRALFALTSRATESRFRTGAPGPPDVLRAYYRAAERRFGVHWEVLAAVNMIESNFGRLRNISNAGAVGPMQFLPATWAAHGLGGDIHDPHDAIMGAANYLRASGAPASHARALYAYNPSSLYVRAVLRFAHRIAHDPTAYYAAWSWQSFRRTARGDVRLTSPISAWSPRRRPKAR